MSSPCRRVRNRPGGGRRSARSRPTPDPTRRLGRVRRSQGQGVSGACPPRRGRQGGARLPVRRQNGGAEQEGPGLHRPVEWGTGVCATARVALHRQARTICRPAKLQANQLSNAPLLMGPSGGTDERPPAVRRLIDGASACARATLDDSPGSVELNVSRGLTKHAQGLGPIGKKRPQ